MTTMKPEDLSAIGFVVVIATKGRPEATGLTLDLLSQQTLLPRKVIFSASCEDDIGPYASRNLPVQVLYGKAGLTRQRNRALDLIEQDPAATFVVFFDDDFLPSKYWLERAAKIFSQKSDVVGLSGTVLADGARGAGITTEIAEGLLESADRADYGTRLNDACSPAHSLYGCNMAFRLSAIAGLRFDERLPAYGWQEDQDFSSLAARKGRIVNTGAVWGVHLGSKAGRTSGFRLGVSQIINPVYMLRKGTIAPLRAVRLIAGNVAANVVRSIVPDPHVDRWGRLRGNGAGILSLISGACDPEIIDRYQ